MRWLRRLLGWADSGPRDVAERLTASGPFRRIASESTSLADRETVQRWVRELRPEQDAQVFVHRPWGIVAAVSDGRNPITLVLSDGEHSWQARVPGATDQHDLTLEQIEHVVLAALTAPERPAWPEWQILA